MSDLKQLSALCSQFTILYAEDDEQTQLEVAKTLKRIFKEVYLASDGEMGIYLFKEQQPDIVITDIQMPRLNGLEMTKAIKELSPKTPIIVTTAFNDEHYFLKAIENDIDSFLLKPIDKEKLFQALFKHISHIVHEQKARELEENKKIDEINQASEESIQSLANLCPFPTLFYKENKLIFINSAGKQTLQAMQLESFQQETMFVSRFNITKDKKQKIKLPTISGLHRIYWLYPNALFVGVDYTLVQAYIFVDITMIEYQKLRLDNYALYANQQINLAKKPLGTLVPLTVKEYVPHIKDTVTKEKEQAILRKTTIHKITAIEFTHELGDGFLDELEEVKELQDFLVNFSYDFKDNQQQSILIRIADIILCYARTMEKLYEFKELGYALRSISELLGELDATTCNAKKLSVFLISISEDLFTWYTNIFINKNAVDIHYLDSSLLSSCLQMEAEFKDGHTDDFGDDLELF